jgi:hypothetical protein
MCIFCNKIKPKNETIWTDKRDFKNDSLSTQFDAIIDGNKLIFNYDAYSTDSSFYEEIEINFCPKCGRTL